MKLDELPAFDLDLGHDHRMRLTTAYSSPDSIVGGIDSHKRADTGEPCDGWVQRVA